MEGVKIEVDDLLVKQLVQWLLERQGFHVWQRQDLSSIRVGELAMTPVTDADGNAVLASPHWSYGRKPVDTIELSRSHEVVVRVYKEVYRSRSVLSLASVAKSTHVNKNELSRRLDSETGDQVYEQLVEKVPLLVYVGDRRQDEPLYSRLLDMMKDGSTS